MKYAEVYNGVVRSIGESNSDELPVYGMGELIAVEVGEKDVIKEGDIWDGAKFVSTIPEPIPEPIQPVTLQSLLDQLKANNELLQSIKAKLDKNVVAEPVKEEGVI